MTKISALLVLVFLNSVAFAQVGIGTTNPNSSAQLDITSTSKGFLPPRVALTGTADVSTIVSPATGLLIYNTATAGTAPNNVVPGYYYYNGTQWLHLAIVTVDNTYKLASTGTASVINTQQSITTYGSYVAINNSAITVSVPSGYSSSQVVLQWNIWGDVNTTTVATGSLRFEIVQTGTSSNTISSVMMTGWSVASGTDVRYSAPVSYIISNLAAGTYTFNLYMQRETESGTITAFNFWGLSGTGQVFVQ